MRSARFQNEETMKETFSKNLKYLRQTKPNLSQQAIAEILGISQRSVSNYENGKKLPPFYIIERFCLFFDVSMEEILQTNLNDPKGGNE